MTTKAERLEQVGERERAIAQLHRLCPPGTTVYTILRHISKSGMLREISLYVKTDDGMQWLDGYARHLLGLRLGKQEGLRIRGCGMDMGFELVYQLSHRLYPEGFSCIGDGCPSNDHSNGDRNHDPHPHRDGGYALRQRWL